MRIVNNNKYKLIQVMDLYVPQTLINDLWVFLFQKIAKCVNVPVGLEHLCMSKLL